MLVVIQPHVLQKVGHRQARRALLERLYSASRNARKSEPDHWESFFTGYFRGNWHLDISFLAAESKLQRTRAFRFAYLPAAVSAQYRSDPASGEMRIEGYLRHAGPRKRRLVKFRI